MPFHDDFRLEKSQEGIWLVFGAGKYPQDPPRVASEVEIHLWNQLRAIRSYNKRDDHWNRTKGFLPYDGSGIWDRYMGDADKWVRYSAEVPPELDIALKTAQRVSLGASWDGYRDRPTNASRANLTRAALRLYLNVVDPMIEEEPTTAVASDADGTATEEPKEIDP